MKRVAMASRNRLHDILDDDILSGGEVTDGVLSVARSSLDSDVFDRSTLDTCSQRGAGIGVCFGLRQFLCRALKDNFSSADHERPAPLERPRRPTRNIDSLCRVTQLTKEEVKWLYRAFKQECPTGTAEVKHFRSLLHRYFPLGDCSSYALRLFQMFDVQQKGYLTFEEFVSAVSSLTRGTTADKLRWIFRLYDVDADGFISRQELSDVIVAVHRLAGDRGQSAAPVPGNVSKRKARAAEEAARLAQTAVLVDLANQQADCFFQKFDVNGAGLITMETFVQVGLEDPTIVSSIERLYSDL